MRNLRLPLSLLILLVAPAALATVNHGDYLGGEVDFLDVSETTTTAGDPEPLWEAPVLAGVNSNQLLFTPAAFLSQCTPAGGTDSTASDLEITIESQAGVHIETVALVENGDVTILPPAGGNATTNATASLSGEIEVIEDIGGPIVPVIIPFTGTFMPKATFELPIDGNTSLWSGSMNIDVAASVPNATKAILRVTNDLTTNCAPGRLVKMQKKVVSGPTVALMVNPLQCDLELDKTCCVTQPVIPNFGSCEGDLLNLKLEYTGDSCRGSNNDQGRAFRCYGRRSPGEPVDIDFLWDGGVYTAVPDTAVNFGDVIDITSSNGAFNDWTKIETTGTWSRRQIIKLNTSCDRALQCGDQFGAYEVVGYDSSLGGVVDCNAPPPPPVCELDGDPAGTPCDAKLVDMVLEYNGQACQNPLGNPQNGEASCSGDATGATNVGVIYTGKRPYNQQVSPASNINDGDRIRVSATCHAGLFPNQEFKIVDGSGVRQTLKFHVSCSQPLALGDEFGSFKVVEFTTKNGTQVALGGGNPPTDSCEVPLAPPGPHCTSDLQSLTLVYIDDYLGEGCTVSNPQGGYGTCTGVPAPGDPVTVVAGPGLTADPVDLIEFGDLVTLEASGGGDLPTFTTLDVIGAGGSQMIQIKTSCHKPLSLGDRFGSFVVFGMDRENDGPISLGGNVQYQYNVTNPNGDTVDNVEVSDDQLGLIVSGASIPAGETHSWVKGATLYGTTTNVATASGDIGGDVCNPGLDQVTVNVTAPPPGSFYCSEPISELTLIWNGHETIDVKAWEGAVGGNLLTSFDNVAKGDAITIDGFGATYPTLEIFDATGTVKRGESKFDLWCNDPSMNGIEDCGTNNGNLKQNDNTLYNLWLLEGMVDSDEVLKCTPDLVPNPPACGFGPELMLVMPGLMWLHRRRLKKAE